MNQRLHELADRMAAGIITPDQCAELERLLHNDPAAQRRYVNYLDLHAQLHWNLRGPAPGRVQGSEFRVQVTSTPTLRRSRSVWYLSATAAAALIALAVTAWFLYAPTNQPPTLESSSASAPMIAMLSDVSADAAFDAPGQPMTLGGNLAAGPIRLLAGSAQVMFESGAVVDLSGPCEFRMVDAGRGVLRTGRLEAYVPPNARGFTVESTHATVVDLGTRFGMNALSGGPLHVRVFEGQVQVRPTRLAFADAQTLTLTRGKLVTLNPATGRIIAGRFTPDGRPLTIAEVHACNADGEPDSPADENVDHAVDHDPTAKYLNKNTRSPGLVVHPAQGLSTVTALTLTAANDDPPRDPASFALEGSNDGGLTWSPIASGPIAPFAARHATQSVTFDNDALYNCYRLSFPSLAGGDDVDCMQIGEVEFIAERVLTDVTRPGDRVVVYNASGSPRPNEPAEGAAQAIDDDPAAKYLNFNKTGAGLTITLLRPAAVRGISLRTANDAPQRDPAAFTVQGSHDGRRFVDIVVDVPVAPIEDRFHRRCFAFDNDVAYTHYRVIFPRLADEAAANSMQIAEIELFADPASSEPDDSRDARRTREHISQRELQ